MTDITKQDLAAMVESVRRLFADSQGESVIRAAMEIPSGIDSAIWKNLVELGVTGLVISADHGGLGGSAIEAEAIMEEAGAVLLCAPLLSNYMAAYFVECCGNENAKANLLPQLVAGKVGAIAFSGKSAAWTAEGVSTTASNIKGEWMLSGDASFVIHGQNADFILVVARTSDGFGLFEVLRGAQGLAVSALRTFDRTLRLAELNFANVSARHIANISWADVEAVLQFGLILLAGEQAGAARRMLEMTVQYAKTRIQFGRAIGSFQAIKHMAADLLLETQSAISAAQAAASAFAEKESNAQELVYLAAFVCPDAFGKVAADAIQMHGGIAFTWDHPAHLYLRRARADAEIFGASPYYRERYLQSLGA